MACQRCKISMYVNDNGIDLFFVTETWLCAHGDKAITVELVPIGLYVKSFLLRLHSRGRGSPT